MRRRRFRATADVPERCPPTYIPPVAIAESMTCPGCGATATGRFCSSCGYPLEGAQCPSCSQSLVPGAGFCHRCGSPVGAAMLRVPAREPPPPDSRIPWIVGGVAAVALVALVLAQRGGASGSGDAVASSFATGAPVMRGPDLSTMSPRERADRLFNRVMSYHERGVTDSVAFFADMGIRAYQMLPVLDADARYDMGRIAEVAGNAAVAKAQADSILRESSTHLLGLTLAARAARLTNDQTAARTFDRRLLAADRAERAKGLVEYERHARDIDEAIRTARSQTP
jgi:hypothetical protein